MRDSSVVSALPHLAFQRSKQSAAVLLSVEMDIRDELNESAINAQLFGYISAICFRSASSWGVHRMSAVRLRESLDPGGSNVECEEGEPALGASKRPIQV